MMRRRRLHFRRVLILAASLMTLAGGAHAEPDVQPLSLKEAIQRALAHRPELRGAVADVGAAGARLLEARSGYLPTILLQGSATDGPLGAPAFGPLENPGLFGTQPLSLEGLSADPLKKHYGAGLSLTESIFDFGRTQHLIAARSEQMTAARSDQVTAEADVALSVTQAYFGVLRAARLSRLQESNLTQRESTLKQARAFFDAKLRSGVDLELAAANAADAKAAAIAAQGNLKIAFAELNHAMGETGLTEFRLEEAPTQPLPSPATAEAAMDEAAKHRPEVLGAAALSRAADQTLRGVESELMPRLDAIASFGAVVPSPLISANKNYALGLALTIPIYTGGFVEGRVSEEREHRHAANARVEAVREAVRLQAARAFIDVQTREAQVSAAREEVVAGDRSLKLASERYHLELGTIVELTEAETLALAARTRLAEAEYALDLARAELQWAMGARAPMRTPRGEIR